MASSAYPRRLETLAQEAAFKLKRSKEYLTSASILLTECKWRVDAGDPDAEGAGWTDYCRVRFPECSLSYIRKLVHVGSQPDNLNDAETAAPQEEFDRVWSAFIALDRKRQHDLLRCGTAYVARSEVRPRGSVFEASADLPNVVDRLA